MMQEQLQAKLDELGAGLEVPGVSVGVLHDGVEQYAFYGVTSIENPLPVDENTLFQFGSTGKTYTAVAILCLVARGKVELDAPVRTYVPELKLKDESVAEKVTVLQLLNHTAGWSGDLMTNTGDGDDALAKYIPLMADLEQVAPLGETVSYNNASLSLAGRVIEKVTGQTYEQAMKDLVLTPLGLDQTFFFPNEIMTRRFAAGHSQRADGTIVVTRPWAMSRGSAPAGGMSATTRDMISWALFHLSHGRDRKGTQVVDADLIRRMQEPTAPMHGSALGDFVGISWLMRDVEGVRIVAHGGDTVGQHSDFLMVPERNFAISVMTNSGPNGSTLKEELVKWALEEYVGVVETDPESILLGADALAAYAGTYETVAAIVRLTAEDGRLVAKAEIRPEVLKEMPDLADDAANQPPIPLALLPGDGDRYIVPDGPGKGMKGYFIRNESGLVAGVHLGGRLATKTG